MTVTIDASLLTSYYDSRAGVANSAASAASSTNTLSTAPRAPWSSTTVATSASISASASALVSAALSGQPFINEAAAKLSAPSTSAVTNSDYKNLFALYQGLATLQALASAASASTTTSASLSQLQTAFNSGLSQVSSFLQSSPFKQFQIAQGQVSTSETATAVQPSPNYTYQTQPLYTGNLNDAVPAFAGNVSFTLTATKASGTQVPVTFNLADLGAETRSIPNVVAYLNSKLEAAGLTTRFADVRIPATPTTVTEDGKTTTLPAGPDSFALKVVGTGAETLSFSASSSSTGVYVLQGSGVTGSSEQLTSKGLQTVSSSASQQLIKLGTSTSTTSAVTQFTKTLSSATTNALATASGPDGSIYVVSSATKGTSSPQTVLTKYDSAGNVVYTRTLNSQTASTGYSVAVSPDGTKVAVASGLASASSATTSTASTTPAGTTVTEFDATTGNQNWTTNTGLSSGDDHPTGITIGANGQVYVVGETSAPFSKQTQTGSQDIYLQSISTSTVVTGVVANGTNSAGQATGFTKVTQQSGILAGITEFGQTGVNQAGGVVVSGSSVFVASEQGGNAILQRFDVSAQGALTLGLTRNLGALEGGAIAGVTLNASGDVVVAGSTKNPALNAGTVQNASTGGLQAFVATLSTTGAASSSDTLTYYNPGGAATTTGVSVANGQVFLSGEILGSISATSDGQRTSTGFVAAINESTGKAAWTQTLNGQQNVDTPVAITATSSGSSVLDAFGLPEGTLNYTPGTTLSDIASIATGDKFSIQSGTGAISTVTVSANDTLATLATKIQQAGLGTVTATVTPGVGGKTLKIAPSNATEKITLISGPPGQDALAPLGLQPGLLTDSASSTETISSSSDVTKKPYALNLASSINLSNSKAILQAQAQISIAQSTLKTIYLDLNTKPASASKSTSGNSSSAPVPAYITAQISNYKLALARLQGSSGGSSSSASLSLSSLIGG